MAVSDFFRASTRQRVAEAITAIEAQTSAEVVVSVRHRSGQYRQADLYAGAGCAFLALLVLLFAKTEFETAWMPVDVAAAFGWGAFVCSGLPWLRRRLTSRRLMRQNVRTAARAAFYDAGVARKHARTGLLVYVSMFERRVEVVPDIGVKSDELGPDWAMAVEKLEHAVRVRADVDLFLTALGALAGPLARALPPQPDQVDELSNEPVMA
jgi:putative membrane protein